MVKRKTRKKIMDIFFNRCLALHAIYLWLQIEIRDPSRFDNSTFSEKAFYFSLRISLSLIGGLHQNGKYLFFFTR